MHNDETGIWEGSDADRKLLDLEKEIETDIADPEDIAEQVRESDEERAIATTRAEWAHEYPNLLKLINKDM